MNTIEAVQKLKKFRDSWWIDAAGYNIYDVDDIIYIICNPEHDREHTVLNDGTIYQNDVKLFIPIVGLNMGELEDVDWMGYAPVTDNDGTIVNVLVFPDTLEEQEIWDRYEADPDVKINWGGE